ncbi:MAG: hypothetical protein ABIF88_01525 [archaeon]
MFNKKGISAIVATVLIILITVAAVTIIWAAIIPMVSNQLDEGNACLEATSKLSLGAAGYTCWSDNMGDPLSINDPGLVIQVKNGAGGAELEDIKVLYNVAGSSTTLTAIEGAGETFGRITTPPTVIGDVVTCGGDLTNAVTQLPGDNEAVVLCFQRTTGTIFNDQPVSVSIAPVIRIGDALKTCDIAATLPNVPKCSALA